MLGERPAAIARDRAQADVVLGRAGEVDEVRAGAARRHGHQVDLRPAHELDGGARLAAGARTEAADPLDRRRLVQLVDGRAGSVVSTSTSMSAIVSRRRRYEPAGMTDETPGAFSSERTTRSTMSFAVPRRMRRGGRLRSASRLSSSRCLGLRAHAFERAQLAGARRPPRAARSRRCRPGATARRPFAARGRAPGAASPPTAARPGAAARSSAAGPYRPARQASRRSPCRRRAAAADCRRDRHARRRAASERSIRLPRR